MLPSFPFRLKSQKIQIISSLYIFNSQLENKLFRSCKTFLAPLHAGIILKAPVLIRFFALASRRHGFIRPVFLVEVPPFPILANSLGLDDRVAIVWPDVKRACLVLQDLHAQAHRNVECDVTMYEPWPGIVGFERDDHITIGRQQDDIAAGRVDEFEVHVVWVPLLVLCLLKNCKVVAM
jgi:hypothetical protein